MSGITEKNTLGDVIVYDEAGFSRGEITIVSGAGSLGVGTVLGKVTANGKYTASDPAAGDGSEVAVAVLLDDVDATSADQVARASLRHTTLKQTGLVFHANVDDNAKRQTKINELEAVGLIAKQGA